MSLFLIRFVFVVNMAAVDTVDCAVTVTGRTSVRVDVLIALSNSSEILSL